jgi:hypothetical protein
MYQLTIQVIVTLKMVLTIKRIAKAAKKNETRRSESWGMACSGKTMSFKILCQRLLVEDLVKTCKISNP